MDEGLAYDTGNYTKEAVTPGTYVFTKFNGSGSIIVKMMLPEILLTMRILIVSVM